MRKPAGYDNGKFISKDVVICHLYRALIVYDYPTSRRRRIPNEKDEKGMEWMFEELFMVELTPYEDGNWIFQRKT